MGCFEASKRQYLTVPMGGTALCKIGWPKINQKLLRPIRVLTPARWGSFQNGDFFFISGFFKELFLCYLQGGWERAGL